MIKFISAFLLLSITSTAFAASRAELDSQQIKAVADAIIKQHKIAQDESIRAIINKGQVYGDANGVSNQFVVQYLGVDGKCAQEVVEAVTDFAKAKTDVSFFRYPRQSCKQEVGCLTPDEQSKLEVLQAKLEVAKAKKPGCENGRGAAACLSPFDQTAMAYLLAKQNNDPQACQHQ